MRFIFAAFSVVPEEPICLHVARPCVLAPSIRAVRSVERHLLWLLLSIPGCMCWALHGLPCCDRWREKLQLGESELRQQCKESRGREPDLTDAAVEDLES